MKRDSDLKDLTLLAWVGRDEFNDDGKIGIKQGLVPAGFIPLAAMGYHLDRLEPLKEAMESQARTYGKKIRLVRCIYVETLMETEAGEK